MSRPFYNLEGTHSQVKTENEGGNIFHGITILSLERFQISRYALIIYALCRLDCTSSLLSATYKLTSSIFFQNITSRRNRETKISYAIMIGTRDGGSHPV
jgi:hypothetical protein